MERELWCGISNFACLSKSGPPIVPDSHQAAHVLAFQSLGESVVFRSADLVSSEHNELIAFENIFRPGLLDKIGSPESP